MSSRISADNGHCGTCGKELPFLLTKEEPKPWVYNFGFYCSEDCAFIAQVEAEGA